jgi:hypothetical protein
MKERKKMSEEKEGKSERHMNEKKKIKMRQRVAV